MTKLEIIFQSIKVLLGVIGIFIAFKIFETLYNLWSFYCLNNLC